MLAVQTIPNDPLKLAAVMALHSSDGQNLGMFPRGAFEEHAEKKWIFIAEDDSAGLVGYLLYREARERAMVAHLCVRRDFQSKGVGRALMEKLKSQTRHLKGIGLYCRRDYDKARAAWIRYGFAPVSAKRGRGADGAELELWWFDHNHPDLFSMAAARQPQPKLRVAIDANIFFDLHDRTTAESEDSKALQADWLAEEIELLLTPEILVEISRADTEDQRRRSRANVSRHTLLRADDQKLQQITAELQSCFPQGTCIRDDSDLRQVAYAIAADAPFFVTRDADLVERAEPLFAKYGVRVLHPTDLINQLDSLRREAEYRPARIEGSRLTVNLLKADDIDAVAAQLRRSPEEKISEFQKRIRNLLALPRDYECKIACSDTNSPLAIIVTTLKQKRSVRIPLIRFSSESLAPTVGRTLLRSLLEQTDAEPSAFVVTDNTLTDLEKAALSDLGFLCFGEVWIKVAVRGLTTPRELLLRLTGLDDLPAEAKATLQGGLETCASAPSPLGCAEIEKMFWPAKLDQPELPSFVVPIQPRWAQHFFDTGLASQNLFGLRHELHLGLEGAYYCSARNTVLKHPARVLWYVSKGPQNDGSMTVKACSRIEEVLIGKPKDLFKRFSRLGIYEWRDIYELAERDINKTILSFRFSMTERFAQPIDLSVMKKAGVPGPIMSPRAITASQFARLYALGKNLELP